MAQKTMVGARAKVSIDDGSGNTAVIGVFDSCQYGASLGTEGLFILGRYSASEISVNSYEIVQVQCSGFRIVDQGVHTLPKAPKLQDLLQLGRIQIQVEDRQTQKNIATITECVAVNWGEAQNAKGTTKFNITYQGLVYHDESDTQDESSGSTDLP